MNSNKRRQGSGSGKKKECLTDQNFNEIKNLIGYVTGVLLPRIAKLESQVTVLTNAIEVKGTSIGTKRPKLFNLDIDGGSDSENSEDEKPFY